MEGRPVSECRCPSLYPTITYILWAIPLRKGGSQGEPGPCHTPRLDHQCGVGGLCVVPLLATLMARGSVCLLRSTWSHGVRSCPLFRSVCEGEALRLAPAAATRIRQTTGTVGLRGANIAPVVCVDSTGCGFAGGSLGETLADGVDLHWPVGRLFYR